MNRADKIRRVAPGLPDEVVAELASMPVAQVDLLVAGMRQARIDGLEHERALRRTRRANARKYSWYDEAELVARNMRVLLASGRRAAKSLDALEGLAKIRGELDRVIGAAVAELMASGEFSNREIGDALGITRQAIWKTGQRKSELTGVDGSGVGDG